MAKDAAPSDASAPGPAPTSTADRAERLLACVRKACNHDLSNQMVAVQGMLHLLHEEEQSRLSPQGREYVQRALASARRAVDMVQTLKDLTRWAAAAERTEQVDLAEVVRDAQMEINQLFRDEDIAYDLELAAPVVTAGRRSLVRILVELGRLALSVARQAERHLVIRSTTQAEGVLLHLAVVASASPPPPRSGSFGGLESRFEFLVARELSATWNGTLSIEEGAAAPAFVLRLPS